MSALLLLLCTRADPWDGRPAPEPHGPASEPDSNAGEDTTELDELIEDLDHEISRAGLRGKADPSTTRPRRRRSTRRRQDSPTCRSGKSGRRPVGKTYTAPDGKTYRPSMFLTLTCPSYGKVQPDGTPVNPATYDYQRAARDALHFAALFAPDPSALLFTGAQGGPLRRGNFNELSGWPHAVRAIGVEGLHFHDLRHTGNHLAAASGAGLRDLMARMGHDSERAAMIYQHQARGADQAIAGAIDALIEADRTDDGDDGGPADAFVPIG